MVRTGAGWRRSRGVALVIASAFVIASVSGDGEAELLRSAYEHSSSVTFAAILQAIGFAFLVAPLFFLFKAVAARSGRMRNQLVGVIVAAPLFLSVAAVLNAVATNDAANAFVAGNAKPGISAKAAAEDCESEQKDKGAKEFGEEYDGGNPPAALTQCARTKVVDEEASNAVSEASTHGAADRLRPRRPPRPRRRPRLLLPLRDANAAC